MFVKIGNINVIIKFLVKNRITNIVASYFIQSIRVKNHTIYIFMNNKLKRKENMLYSVMNISYNKK